MRPVKQSATPLKLLAEHLLDEPLDDYVLSKRRARPQWPWQLIAEQLAEDTGGQVNLSRETLRLWYTDELGASA